MFSFLILGYVEDKEKGISYRMFGEMELNIYIEVSIIVCSWTSVCKGACGHRGYYSLSRVYKVCRTTETSSHNQV